MDGTPAEAGYTLIQQPASNDPMQVHIYELDNGLQVYLTTNREEPRFYAEIIVRAGSKHDLQDATGIAHYLEHMLFKGSRQLGTLDFEAEKEHLDSIEALYEEHFSETDPERFHRAVCTDQRSQPTGRTVCDPQRARPTLYGYGRAGTQCAYLA